MWRDGAYLLDMLLAAREATQLAQGLTRDRFVEDRTAQLAIMHLVQTVGEAARSVSEEYKAAHVHIPWSQIIGMRHRLVHEYFRIIPEKVWDVLTTDLPALIQTLEPLVPPDDVSRQDLG